jgi:hypothetical protein
MSSPAAASTAAVTRTELHTRRIEMRGYERSDGLFEIEGRVNDRKPVDVTVRGGHTVAANQSIHDMGVRLVFDRDMVVREVHTFTDASPYAVCPEGGRALQAMKGVKLSSGWSRAVRERLAGAASCTHLKELLIPMATAAFQSMIKVRAQRPEPLDANGRPLKIDSCYAYSAESELVQRLWPQFHRPKAGD